MNVGFQEVKETINQMLRSFEYMLTNAMDETTKIYKGYVESYNNDGRWNIKYNGKTHPVTPYGGGTPSANQMVYVFVPQGNQALSWFFMPGGGGGSGDGTTFIPSVSQDGVISWTNDGGLPNPSPVNIKGPQGDQGVQGNQGEQGETGPYYTPSVSDSGDLSWTNNGNLTNPETVNIRGPQGTQGEQGYYYTPSVNSNGDLSWTNNGNLDNPQTVNIKGPQGDIGETGATGPKGETGPYYIPSVDNDGNLSWSNTGELQNPSTVNIKGQTGENGATFTPNVSSDGVLSWTNDKELDNPTEVNIRGPQGVTGETGQTGPQGPYFIPNVDTEGNISWTNNGGLENPQTVNIRGPQGNQGIQGDIGPQGNPGQNGATFTPSVDENGNLSWSNDGGLTNPETVNIKGPQGEQGIAGQDGAQGPQGNPGANATINGVNTLTLSATGGLTGSQSGDTFTISASDLQTNIANIANGTTILPYLPLSGGTMTGNITSTEGQTFRVGIDENRGLEVTTNQTYVGANGANILFGNNVASVQGALQMNNQKVTQVATPTEASDGANKQYVDNAVANVGSSPITGQFNGTLPASGWIVENGQYYYQITIADITANDAPIAIPQWTNKNTQQSVWNNLVTIQSFAGYVRFYSSAAFTTAINFILYY